MNDRHPDGKPDRDDIGTLIRIAEPHEGVPADRTARVRAAAHAAWTGEVAGRRRRIGWTLAAVAAAAAVTLLAFTVLWDPKPMQRTFALVAGTVERVEGNVDVARSGGGNWSALALGDTIEPGDALRAIEGRASLSLVSGHALRVDRSTLLRLRVRGGIELDSGAVYLDSGIRGQQAPIELHTPYGLVREIGTQYETRIDANGLLLRLREGAVVLESSGGEHTVRAGNELRLSDGGTPQTTPIDVHGPAWDWVLGLAAVPSFDGASADTFLRWIARERGWTLVFAEVAVAATATETRIDGDLSSFSPEEALEVVAVTTRLRFVIENDELRVWSEPAPD